MVSASNILVGSTANDAIGNRGITALQNGNYVLQSGVWDNNGLVDVGQVQPLMQEQAKSF